MAATLTFAILFGIAGVSAQDTPRIYTNNSKIFLSGSEVVFPSANNMTISRMVADTASLSSSLITLAAQTSSGVAALATSLAAASSTSNSQFQQAMATLASNVSAVGAAIAAVNTSLVSTLDTQASAQTMATQALGATVAGLAAIVPGGARLSAPQLAAAFWAATYNRSQIDANLSSISSSSEMAIARGNSLAAQLATVSSTLTALPPVYNTSTVDALLATRYDKSAVDAMLSSLQSGVNMVNASTLSTAQTVTATSAALAALSSTVLAQPATYPQTQLDAIFATLYNRTQVNNITSTLQASVSSQFGALAACNDAGQFYDPTQGACRNVAIKLPQTPNAPCGTTDTGRIRYDAVNNQLLLCNGTTWAAIVTATASCTTAKTGLSIDCPAASCAALKSVMPTSASGKYYVGAVPASLVYCDMSTNGVSLGGDGSSVTAASYGCPILKKYWNASVSTAYFIRVATGTIRVYCDMALAGGGFMLVWKHSYMQVGTLSDSMRYFSQFDNPCTDLSDGWCNVPNKALLGASVQMLAAYHSQALVYAYTGSASPQNDATWMGGILNAPQMVVDLCTGGSLGVAPEPSCTLTGGNANSGYCGITFDKWNAGVYQGNCDTDRYTATTNSDCRWENCAPSFGTHSQMTIAMYMYVPETKAIALATALQSSSFASCVAAKQASNSAVSGPYKIVTSGGTFSQWCDMTGVGVSLGGDGSSLTNPAPDCNTLYRAWGKPSGTYYLSTSLGIRQAYCYNEIGNGGWMLVWKHSYYEVGTPSAIMTTFSQYDQPCLDLFVGWCNTPGKNTLGASEMMTAAFHSQGVVYAYNGPINPLLDTSWKGAIIPSFTKVVDTCTRSVGVAPEPECGGAHAFCGITFDKATTGDYISNCDTDHYGPTGTGTLASGSDCRFQNCIPSFGYDTQMTMGIFLRTTFGALAPSYTSCKALKIANPTYPTGSYTVSLGGNQRTVYCENVIDGGGYTMMWKQSYYQSGVITDNWRMYSTFSMPCTDLSQSWCNEPLKGSMEATTMMLVAYNDFRPIYAYKVAYNPAIATTWTALKDFSFSTMVLDLCGSGNGLPVEPACGGAFAMCGVTFDKATQGDYISNCDTDRYGSGSDCRWENCNPSFGTHMQMTLVLYVK